LKNKFNPLEKVPQWYAVQESDTTMLSKEQKVYLKNYKLSIKSK